MNNGLKNVKHSHESSVAMKCCQCKACCLSGILLDFKSIARIAFYHPTEQLFSKKAPTYAAADRRHAGSAKYKSRRPPPRQGPGKMPRYQGHLSGFL